MDFPKSLRAARLAASKTEREKALESRRFRMAKSAGMTQSAKAPNPSRAMISASASVAGLDVAFADGVAASVPWERVREVGGLSDVVDVSLGSPYEALISTKRGERAEIPWDFARAFGDAAFESQMDEAAALGRRKFAARLRDRRRAAGMSRRELSAASGVDCAALARLETAAQSPKLGVTRRLAAALGCPVHSLLMDDDPDETQGAPTQ